MTKQELMAMPNLKISEEVKDKFVHIHTEDGYKITDYFDGQDIKKYTSCSCMYCPISDNYKDYRTITNQENEVYMEAQQKAVEEEMKKEQEKLNK